MGIPREIAVPRIMSEAERIFGRHGFAGASMVEIARASQLPKANVHYYFGTKEALYRAVLENTLSGWLADARHWLSPHRTASEGLRGYIAAKLAFSRDHADASKLFAHEILRGGEHVHTYLTTTLRMHVDLIGETLAIWAGRGEIRAVDPPYFIFSLWAMTQFYADMNSQITAVLNGEVDFDRATGTILGLLLHGESPERLDATSK
ncbi:TetR family transcriptional regulator [Neoasaia chiangmaiensis NBRC 101099]|uniref:TetR/AcrR family transcriptional regulator n=1 Tax=Neoasaia chiangmaiensis TaxID=320497 RepID=UPI0011941962|nr:TetR/AcrR family transcriptional regulator [Neoasaia chiangmaiensis]GBR37717.1 TetR family transcriptional regulator [Neoasaia chiangmaiensis NBRC 101099]GEN15085.1 TetR family transcriptional regulator [Neoasaia chiangmaiensis]